MAYKSKFSVTPLGLKKDIITPMIDENGDTYSTREEFNATSFKFITGSRE